MLTKPASHKFVTHGFLSGFVRNGSPNSFSSYRHIKLKLRVFLRGYSVAIVISFYVGKMITTC